MYCKKDLCQENQIALPVTETGSFTPGYLGNSLFMEEGAEIEFFKQLWHSDVEILIV